MRQSVDEAMKSRVVPVIEFPEMLSNDGRAAIGLPYELRPSLSSAYYGCHLALVAPVSASRLAPDKRLPRRYVFTKIPVLGLQPVAASLVQ